MESLRHQLHAWLDWDGAAYSLAQVLGILEPSVPLPAEAKHVFWSRNDLGDALQDILQVLVRIGALKYEEEEQKYRWNAGFVWREASARGGR